MVAVSAYIGGTRSSGVLPSAGDVLEMSVVRGVGGVCDMCVCLALDGVGGVGGEWVRGLGLGFTNPGGTWGKWDVCLRFGRGGVGGVMSVCVLSLDSLCSCQVQVSVYCARRIHAHLRCTQYSILLYLIDICFLTCICL